MRRFPIALAAVALFVLLFSPGCSGRHEKIRAALVEPGELQNTLQSAASLQFERLKGLSRQGFNAVVVKSDGPMDLDWLRAGGRESGLDLYLWIDVGRSEELARAHPEWVAGMGMHDDWRRRFPDAPKPGAGERVGVWPWTPIWYKAALEARERAIVALLRGHTKGIAGVFLDHVQGAPSACGCGNDRCRWTADYGMKNGPEQVEGCPAALLITELKRDLPGVRWLPVWVPECAEEDQPGPRTTGKCGSVHCFEGRCWKETSKELAALERVHRGLIAVHRSDGHAHLLSEVPPRHGGPSIAQERLVTFQASPWSREALEEALDTARKGAGGGLVLVRTPLDESWEPRLVSAAASGAPPAPGAQPPAAHPAGAGASANH